MQTAIADRTESDWLAWRLRRDDGRIRYVESRGTPVVYDGKPAAQVVIRDVTAQRHRQHRLEALNDATRTLLTADSKASVAQTTVDVVAEVLDEPFAGVFEYTDGHLVPVAATRAASERTGIPREAFDRFELGPGTVELAAFEDGVPRIVEEYGTREDTRTDLFETVFLYPLSDHGLLSVASAEADAFDSGDRDLLEILGQSVIAALDRLTED